MAFLTTTDDPETEKATQQGTQHQFSLCKTCLAKQNAVLLQLSDVHLRRATFCCRTEPPKQITSRMKPFELICVKPEMTPVFQPASSRLRDGTYLLSRTRIAWIVRYRWRAVKSINFILKFYLLSNYKEEWRLLTYCLSTCLSWSSDLTRYCNLGNENSDAGPIKCSRGP